VARKTGLGNMPIVFDPTGPLTKLGAFAESLGWEGLEVRQHEEADGTVITRYSAGHRMFLLPINGPSEGQVDT
jgi:hypothetical protein